MKLFPHKYLVYTFLGNVLSFPSQSHSLVWSATQKNKQLYDVEPLSARWDLNHGWNYMSIIVPTHKYTVMDGILSFPTLCHSLAIDIALVNNTATI